MWNLNWAHCSCRISLWLLECFIPGSVRWLAVVPVELRCHSNSVPPSKKNKKKTDKIAHWFSPAVTHSDLLTAQQPSLPASLPLDFSFPSSDTEMRLEIELCIFHEVPNASAPAAPPRSGLCFALSIPNNFYFFFFFYFFFLFFMIWLLILVAAKQTRGNKSRYFMRFLFFPTIRCQPIIATLASPFVAFFLTWDLFFTPTLAA